MALSDWTNSRFLNGQINSVHSLRGLAALAVCLYHLDIAHPPSEIHSIFHYGRLGVQVFFVISGFVLPLAMSRSGYTTSAMPSFLLRRVVRIEPPYLCTIAFIVTTSALAAITPGYRGALFSFDPMQVLLHAAYLAPLFGKLWLSPVFWTLAVEFQFYLLIAAIYPVLERWPALSVAALALLSLGPGAGDFGYDAPGADFLLFPHLGLFAAGMMLFLWHRQRLASREVAVLTVLIAGLVLWRRGSDEFIAGSAAIIFIIASGSEYRIAMFFGTISYSLYLVHFTIYGRVFNLVSRFTDEWLVLAALCLAASVLAAWFLCVFVEKPAVRLSQRLRRNPQPLLAEAAQ